MFKQLLISTAISAALFSTPLLAAEKSMGSDNPQTTGQGNVGNIGTNDAGGQASTSAHGADFDELDRNKDGELDEDELNRFGATAAGSSDNQGDKDRGERMMKQYDRDDDGSVTKEEFDSGSESKSGTTLEQ
ncbi:EF-hand domain-containing protein [Marinobacter sp. ATCH36]|uniref:EF-hand domain-containing protein n=1 Tax=Marinobacter sp. ATCH36 TaxID=2945106 RepID=UPI002020C567|nr:EF-hand domain-containing protein [Marinobacter sp. ATCH36]MCL7945381.1 EF-hand domain-containing protein [Marinobacter sp. ATCH36]